MPMKSPASKLSSNFTVITPFISNNFSPQNGLRTPFVLVVDHFQNENQRSNDQNRQIGCKRFVVMQPKNNANHHPRYKLMIKSHRIFTPLMGFRPSQKEKSAKPGAFFTRTITLPSMNNGEPTYGDFSSGAKLSILRLLSQN